MKFQILRALPGLRINFSGCFNTKSIKQILCHKILSILLCFVRSTLCSGGHDDLRGVHFGWSLFTLKTHGGCKNRMLEKNWIGHDAISCLSFWRTVLVCDSYTSDLVSQAFVKVQQRLKIGCFTIGSNGPKNHQSVTYKSKSWKY